MKEHNDGREHHSPDRRNKAQRVDPSENPFGETLFEKRYPKRLPPDRIFGLCLEQANELAESSYTGRIHSSVAVGFAKVSQHYDDLGGVQEWTRVLEEQVERNPNVAKIPTDPGYENNVARLYFIGASLGDEQAFRKLEDLLADERDRYDDEEKSIHTMNLTNIVMEAAQAGLPADIWINRFAKDKVHKLELKSQYVSYTSEIDAVEESTATRYIHDISKALFQEETSDEVFWDHAVRVMQWDDNEAKRAAIVHEAISRTPDTVDDRDFDIYLTFASVAVEDGLVTEEQATAMQEHAENYALHHHLAEDTHITLSRFELFLALMQDTPADELMPKIKANTQFQREHTLPRDALENEPLTGVLGRRYTRESAESFEDNFLVRCVRHYAQKHDFQSAKSFIGEIKHEGIQLSALAVCLRETRTQEDLSLLKEEGQQETLAASFIRAQELFFTQQPDERAEAIELLTKDVYMLEFAETWVQKAYEASIQEGRTFAHELIRALRPLQLSYENKLGDLQLHYGDPDGFQTKYDYLQKVGAKGFLYLALARKCQQWMTDHVV